MTMDLGQLFDDKPKAPKFDILKVYHKESGEVRLIKSTRFDSRYHSMNIPRNAVEKLDFNHPNKAIELSLDDLKAPSDVPVEKVDTSTVSDIRTPEIGFNDGTPIALAGQSDEQDSKMAEIAKEVDEMVLSSFICSKGCGKVCTSNAGRAAHERACKYN